MAFVAFQSAVSAENSIEWSGGALVVIDQRVLPREFVRLRLTTVDEVIDAIKTLAIRGAPAIGVAGGFAVALAAFAHDGDPDKIGLEAQRIAAARPTAVNLVWGVRRALARVPDGPQAVLAEALQMLAEDGQLNRVAATHAADLIERLCPGRPLRVLTHCNTGRLATAAFGTALGALRVLHARGLIDSVLVDETRPLLQGARLTAWELAEAGIPHRLTIDSAAAWAMATGQVDCVIVGADRVAADGSVANKIGTYALAVAAARHDIPFVVVAPESTRDPATPTGREIVVEERGAAEVTHVGDRAMAPEGIAVFNPAFDVTPPELVTAVVTENGFVEPKGVVEQEITDISHALYARGWMPGTAGNISVRTGETAVITGSGLSKGELTEHDMVTVKIADSQPVSGKRRPSAETAIHTAIYRATNAEAVVHVHPPHATAQSIDAREALRFSGYELIKGLGAAETIDIPVFDNHSDVARIGTDIERHLTENPTAAPVLIIAGHGITAWGATLAQARDRAECLEGICELVTLTGRREVGRNLTT
ncbi:methylthioribulose-1-phosphate dehydratase [Mycobacterium intermedium]|uniref:Methylthioribose-1-phosphate isomerase n=1 Tax=Mycobacterium intermedium TaxID=28445 RepID=A0A1E3SBU3_MYCIE|nr:bifunctional S-methyl-5-thioribose-1-phosphate isomerase/methylthioribulose 1-phosphate dehydratase [Mycobacterium intermedium]MCV6964244.1 bifunctional S-methyl-5-thioribose-1-phosphate isomerase/methylthioribulose 1-phosphate dehydratase [Mycobacterium intermedium]ODQ99027.1 methylthioribulose-1-phosphate dehydratase [Mycobacterium intermedium]OPE46415.1 methylthioribulose-1-phosphate dehydratase [Mycobacterium intermedium]ORB05308.1 methylthioribulose-1-phosphate dehydratase [Mycobacteriu